MNQRAGLLLLSLVLVLVAACDKEKKDDTKNGAPAAPSTTASVAAAAKTITTLDAATLDKYEVPEVRVRAETVTTVRVTWNTPSGTTVNDDAPFRVRWNRSDGLFDAPADVKATGKEIKAGFDVKVKPMKGAPNATLDGAIDIVVCDSATHSVCLPVHRTVGLGFIVTKDASDQASVSIPLPEAHVN